MRRNRSVVCWFCGLALLATAVANVAPLRAQDDPGKAGAQAAPSDQTKPDAAKPDADKSDAEKPDPAKPDADKPDAAPAPPGDPAAAFAAKLQEWKDLIKQLRSINAKYQTAGEAEMQQLHVQWDELVDKGNKMVPELRAAGMAAYKASPNTDRDLAGFLVKLAQDDVQHDLYDSGLEVCRLLIDNETDRSDVYDIAGIASFSLNDFDAAGEYFQKAKDAGALSDAGQSFADSVEDYKGYWAEEQELRKKEAEADDLPRVKLSTSKGDIVLELFENEAPQTVGNFINLVEKNFYDGRSFHRVIANFMAQGGDPNDDGTGGPGYKIYCECYKPDYRKHFRGSLSMAHAGKDTGGSQFFITFRPTPELNGKHTVFGRVIEGMDVLAKLQRRTPPPLGSVAIVPRSDTILDAEVLRKRDHVYMPTKVEP